MKVVSINVGVGNSWRSARQLNALASSAGKTKSVYQRCGAKLETGGKSPELWREGEEIVPKNEVNLKSNKYIY